MYDLRKRGVSIVKIMANGILKLIIIYLLNVSKPR